MLLHDDTYIGGHVESLEAGIFRSDLPVVFGDLDCQQFQEVSMLKIIIFNKYKI